MTSQKKKNKVEENWRESERWQTEKDLALSLLEAGATGQALNSANNPNKQRAGASQISRKGLTNHHLGRPQNHKYVGAPAALMTHAHSAHKGCCLHPLRL